MTPDVRNSVGPGKTDKSVLAARACAPDFEQVVELPAGRYLVRPLRPEDSRAYADFIARMDESDLQHAPARPSAENDFTERGREIAFVAIAQGGPARGEIVGEVRAYRYPSASTAELVIMVRSDLKGRGLGRALLEHMIACCGAYGLELIAQIRPENTAMIRLAQRCGMEVEHRPGSELAIAHLACHASTDA